MTTRYTMYVDLDDGDRSPFEVATLVQEALLDKGVAASVKYGDLDTIMWTTTQEDIEGIVYQGPGYGAPRHRAILTRAGYGHRRTDNDKEQA